MPNAQGEGFGIREGPLADQVLQRAQNRRDAEERATWGVRPVRLKAVGQRQAMTEEDQAFLQEAMRKGWAVAYLQENPKSGQSRDRYERYKVAGTLEEAMRLGASRADIRWDYERSFIFFFGRESSNMAGVVGAEVEKIWVGGDDTRMHGESPGEVFHATSQLHQYLQTAFAGEETPEWMNSKQAMMDLA
tara:strand:+ start:244 stop:813 length:570 start_codon:yes stop_codon:yes gene_type:complete